MGDSTARLTVIVVNYGSHALLAEIELPDEDWLEVVVVDNDHSEAERVAVTALSAERGWTCLPQAANVGFGAGVNAGLRHALDRGAEAFLLLNPDARVSAGVLAELRRLCLERRDALISPVMVTSTGASYFRGSQLDLASGRTRGGWSEIDRPAVGEGGRDGHWVDWLTGACLAFHADALARVGWFDEPYFLYREDVDFSRRAVAAGLDLVLVPELSVVHDEGGTQRRPGAAGTGGVKSPVYYRYNCRNRLLFAARHLGRRGLLRWLLRTPTESLQILRRGGRRHLIEQPSHLWAGIRGTAEGVGFVLRVLVSPPAEPR